ncbi:MAG: hypothetical protein AAGJ37_07075 [Pseudomonadota bacterium]
MVRPLFKHIRDHDTLFKEMAIMRNQFVSSIGLVDYVFHKTPKLVTNDGLRLSIEPERSIVLDNYQAASGFKSVLTNKIHGFHIVENSDIGYRYPTAALAGDDAPFIKRFRSEYFHKTDEARDICRPINLSFGIKSRGKEDNRQEYEVWLPEQHLKRDPSPLLVERYGDDLPPEVLAFASEAPLVHGWMGVKRCAFEGIFLDPKNIGDIVICISLSLDAYNIGAKPDLSYSDVTKSSLAYGGAELEWEVLGYYCPEGEEPSHDDIWRAIDHSIKALCAPLEEAYHQNLIDCNESKTERILSAISNAGNTAQDIAALNLKPWEFLQTESENRKKPKDSSRSINLLGRLNRLFYNPEFPLPSLRELHHLAALPW